MWIDGKSWFDWTVAELLDRVRQKRLIREGEAALGDFSDPKALAAARNDERGAYRALGHLCLNMSLPADVRDKIRRYRELKGQGDEAAQIEYDIGMLFANGKPEDIEQAQ